MTADELRKSILQMAVQGKLVDQDPNDEPASVLLDKIKEERKKLIQSGKIKGKFVDSVIYKGDDNSYYEKVGNKITDITDEIPFDLPVGWSWCRLSNICEMYTGDSINETEKKKKYTGLSEGMNYIGTKDVNFDRTIVYDNGVRIPNDCIDNFRKAPANSILLCIEGGSAGRKIAITNQMVCFGNKLCCFSPYVINSAYLYYYLQSPSFIDVFKSNTTGIIGGVSINVLKGLLFALPPLKEQERIINKVNELEPLLADYDKLETTERTLTENLPNELRKSILQYAIQGKLVPQDPNEEPASVLLERIRQEKQQQLGKKSKKNTDSFIYKNSDDNSYYPFDIPRNWCWCQLQDIVELISGRDLEKQDYNDKNNGIPYITGASNINNDEIIINRWTDKPQVVSVVNDLLLTCKGTVGTMVFNKIGNIHIARQIMALRSSHINMEYLRVFLESYVDTLQANAKSMIPGISRDNVLLAYFPLPPIKEQERIVNAIKNSLILLNSLIMRTSMEK